MPLDFSASVLSNLYLLTISNLRAAFSISSVVGIKSLGGGRETRGFLLYCYENIGDRCVRSSFMISAYAC